MRIEFQRQTLREQVEFCGVGIHSGEFCRAVIRPGDNGIAITKDGTRIAASAKNVTETERCTTLGTARTIEHMMSAFAGANVTDAEAFLEGEEMPILDGSANEYLIGIQHAGIRPLGKTSAVRLDGCVRIEDGCQSIIITAGDGKWRYTFERNGHWPGRQSFEVDLSNDAYACEIAPARTFAFEDELDSIRKRGLGKGGALENTLVIGQEGYLTGNRFADEAPRHKLLDCIGDLALCGIPVRFLNVIAERTGHRINVQAALKLAGICHWEVE